MASGHVQRHLEAIGEMQAGYAMRLEAQKIIGLGVAAVPQLIRSLGDASPVAWRYYASLSLLPTDLLGSLYDIGDSAAGQLQQATIGDVADYCLRMISGRDMGYHSYDSPVSQRAAIERWHEWYRACRNAERGSDVSATPPNAWQESKPCGIVSPCRCAGSRVGLEP
jgi:hypothetical protein